MSRGSDVLTSPDEVPLWLWKASIGVLVGVLVFIAALLALALGGISDPRPLGDLTVDASLGDTYLVEVANPRARTFVMTSYTIHPPATVEVTARQVDGPSDAGYGLWWGSGPDNAFVVVVNGNGYYAVYKVEGSEIDFIVDWQTFPHLRSHGEPNRIRADLTGDQVVVRINDELAAVLTDATGRTQSTLALQIGFVVEALTAGGAAMQFDHLRVWQSH